MTTTEPARIADEPTDPPAPLLAGPTRRAMTDNVTTIAGRQAIPIGLALDHNETVARIHATGTRLFAVCSHFDTDNEPLITARPDGSTLCTGCGWSHPDPPASLTATVAIVGLHGRYIGASLADGLRRLSELWTR